MRKPWGLLLLACLIAPPAAQPRAEDHFPSHTIQLIVPTPPGGGTDVVSRLLASLAEPELGQKIVVLNKPGAGGSIGMEVLARAKPDGYTIGGVYNTPMTVTPNAFQVSYSPKSFDAIMQDDLTPVVFCVHKDFPADTAAELVKVLKANPDKYTYGTDGAGGGVHLSGELIFSALGVKMRAIPFGGAGETISAFLAGTVDMYGGSVPPVMAHSKNGTAKCLLLTTVDGSPMLPMASGVGALGIPQAETVLWHGLVAPAGVPADRLRILTEAFQKAAQTDKFRAFTESQGGKILASDGPAFGVVIEKEYVELAAVMEKLGLAKTSNGGTGPKQ
jgi:tripartite-type tricarboxylate transporter receptor subunit TctC